MHYWLNFCCYVVVVVMIVVVAVVTLAAVVEVVAVHYSFVQFYRNQSCTWSGIQNSAMDKSCWSFFTACTLLGS